MTELLRTEEAMPLPDLAAFQDRLLTAFDAATAITLDLSKLVRFDIGFIQLVEAARFYARQRGTTFALTAPATEPVEALLRRAGFLTDPVGEDTLFWLHGATQ